MINCSKLTQLDFSEIKYFLEKSGRVNKITINIVYYNSLLKEVFKNNLFKKNISPNCNIIFTKLDEY